MKRIWFLLVIVIEFFPLSCEKNNPLRPENFPPILSNLIVPDTVITMTGQDVIATVKCSDPNGTKDVDSVCYKIFKSEQLILFGILFDDGNYEQHGDNIAQDGKYSIRLNLESLEGNYRFVVQAVDYSNMKSNELEEMFYVKPGVINHAPIITENYLPDSVYVDQIVPFLIRVQASDPDSMDYIARVSYQILGPVISEMAEEGVLTDDGSYGDSLAGDGIYTKLTTTGFANWKFGSYHLLIQAVDSRMKASSAIYKILSWAKLRLGVAPRINTISAPDTIKLPTTGDKSFTLTAKVTDADDNRDIKEVFFNSFKPDGSPSSGNPFKMYDDGTSGDAITGDFVYSLRIFITSQNQPGNYRFEFEAKDYSELLSNKIVHIITVVR